MTKRWRMRSGKGYITEEEKSHVREKIISLLDQEDDRMALQVSLAISKIARVDYPKHWPSLFSDLIQRIEEGKNKFNHPGKSLSSRRSWLALHHVIKELSSKRLASDLRVFEQISQYLLEHLWRQWQEDSRIFLDNLPHLLEDISKSSINMNNQYESTNLSTTEFTSEMYLVLERWIVELKILRRLLEFGHPSDAKTLEEVQELMYSAPRMVEILNQVLKILSFAVHLPFSLELKVIDQCTLKLVKVLRQLLEAHPWSFLQSGALVSLLDISVSEIFSPGLGSRDLCRPFLCQVLQVIAFSTQCSSYKGSSSSLSIRAGKGRELSDKLKHLADNANSILKSFWSPKTEQVADKLIRHYFVLTKKELEIWERNGEEFHIEFEHASKDSSVRACAEAALLGILENDRDRLGPCIASLISQFSREDFVDRSSFSQNSESEYIRALMKSAVYHAACVGAYEIHDYVDLTAWLHLSLLREAEDCSRANRPVRRAAIRLLRFWISKIRKEDRKLVYSALVKGISDPDAGISLAATASLRALVDDWDFDESEFIEFVSPIFQSLSQLLDTTVELDAQIDIFSLIIVIIDRLGEDVAKHAPVLLHILPTIWGRSEGQSLLRIQVLLAFQSLVHALGRDSMVVYPVLMPILESSASPKNQDNVSVMEDALLTWLVTLRHAIAFEPLLISPLPHLLQNMEDSTEFLFVGTKIMVSSILLGGAETLHPFGGKISKILSNLIGNVTDKGMILVLAVIDTIVALFPEDGVILLAPVLCNLLREIHKPKAAGFVIANSLNIYGRIMLSNSENFVNIMRLAASHVSISEEVSRSIANITDPTERLVISTLDLWLKHFNAVSQAAGRKLGALSLLAFLSFGTEQVIDRNELILGYVIDVWSQLEGEDGIENHFGVEYLASSAVPKDDDLPLSVNIEEAGGETARRRLLFDSSPIATVRISTFARKQIEHLSTLGNGKVNSLLNGVYSTEIKAMIDSCSDPT